MKGKYLESKLKGNYVNVMMGVNWGIPTTAGVVVSFLVISVLSGGLCSAGLINPDSETFFDTLIDGEGKPPMLSHIRVSRGPLGEGRLVGSQEVPSGSSTGRMSNIIKPPSYQHKMLHTLSQFHGNNAPSYYNDRFGQLVSHNPIYPVTSVQMVRRPGGHNVEQSSGNADGNAGEDVGQFNGNLPEDPTFSPYIGPRALSSIPEFFTHIRDNLDALRELERQEEEQEAFHRLSGSVAEYPHKDLPMRRGDYFNTDGRLSINSDEYGYSYHGNEDKVSGGGVVEDKTRNHGGAQAEEASSDLLKYMGQDPKYKKANGHNPSWLFTGLGLGKRSKV